MSSKNPEPQSLDDLAAEAEAIEAEQAEIDANRAAGGPAEEPASDALEAVTAERDDFRDKFFRALAEAENARKRADRSRREGEAYGASRLAGDLLPIYDNLSRALDAVGEDLKKDNAPLVEGIELTMRALLDTFTRHGIVQITPEVGDRFDPKIHEAMFEAPVPNTRAGDIIQVMAIGFTLQGRLLRAAQVGVSSTPAN
ncbi:nucleotide exchange factor GrpE [Pseudoroseicyclus tamaricis]|uniref:Protein GrpE n=1 Tax=Pseudoroseicyclus tamaricis TaxID=2705421 RepID=A0A6B2JX30_9RHOB|nr:nucleotide exchange factor GrpE [Pseudoroseicyclus tamaricis]NDV02768.1 nucleotide exchange factor GrpE [Pseudoroseicyclus tamaricis]